MSVEIAFARFWAEVGDHYAGNWRTTVETALPWLAKELGRQTLLRDVGSNRIALLIQARRRDQVSNTTVNRTVTELLRTIMRRASKSWQQETQAASIEWGDLILKEPQERIRELLPAEETALVQTMRDDYLPAIRFALLYGLRKAELVGLERSAVNWPDNFKVRGKGDKERLIPLTDAGRAILSRELGRHPTAVFTYVAVANKPQAGIVKGQRHPITYSGLASAWRRHGPSAAGIADFRLHDTRHTAATRLLRKTGNLRLVQKLLGHEDIATTTRYAHVTDEDLRNGLDAVEKAAPTVRQAAETKKTAG